MKWKNKYNGLKSEITTFKQVNYTIKKYNVVITKNNKNDVVKL